MNRRGPHLKLQHRFKQVVAILCIIVLTVGVIAPKRSEAAEPTRSLGFQGQLYNGGVPVTGSVMATFTFYDSALAGGVEGTPINKTVSVSNGYFSTNFSEADLAGINFSQSLWIEVEVNGNTLSPRSVVNSVPLANNAFGVLSYASAPTVGTAGSLYYNSVLSRVYVSDGVSWLDISTSTSQWTTNGSNIGYTAGNVGIGTTTPIQKLVVTHDTLPTSVTVDGVGIRFIRENSVSSTTPNNFYVVNGDASSATGYNSLIFGVRTNADTFAQNVMGISSIGNVGIGATGGSFDYDARLVVLGQNATSSQVNLRSPRVAIVSGNTIGGIRFSSNDTSLSAPGTTTASILALANTAHTAAQLGTDLVFNTTNGTTSGEALRILGNGNVGIGTSSPLAKLVIQANSGETASSLFAIASSTSTTTVNLFSVSNTGAVMINRSGSSSPITGGNDSQNALHIFGTPTQQNTLSMYATGGATNNVLVGYSSPGPAAAPTPTQSGTFLMRLQGGGYNGTTYAGRAEVSLVASETWSATSSGTEIRFQTTANGGNTRTEKIRLTNDGLLGIGTTTPTQALSVIGGMRLTGGIFDGSNASGTPGMVLQSTGTSTSWVATSTLGISSLNYFVLGNGYIATATSTDGFRAGYLTMSSTTAASSFAGNVGIGTTSAATNLSVVGSGWFTQGLTIGNSVLNGVAPANTLVISASGSSNASIAIGNSSNGNATLQNNGNIFTFFHSNGAEFMSAVKAGFLGLNTNSSGVLRGNVGIGTTSPSALLGIQGVSGATTDLVNISTSTNASLFIVKSSGNVGIGTTSPASLANSGMSTSSKIFDIAGLNPFLVLHHSTDLLKEVSILNHTSGTYFDSTGAASATNNSIHFRIGSSNGSNALANTMSLLSNGNVGIGTTTPTAQFTNTGTVRFAALGSGGANLITDSLGNVTVSSDERLKDIQGNFESGLSQIIKIQPVAYKWKPETGYDTTNTYAGFSAQNIQGAIPEAVTTDTRGFLTLADRPILATLVNAVKELATTISGYSESFKTRLVETDKIKTKTLCVERANGTEVCLTGDQIDSIMLNQQANVPTYIAPVITPEPQPEIVDEEVDETPEPTPETVEVVAEPVALPVEVTP